MSTKKLNEFSLSSWSAPEQSAGSASVVAYPDEAATDSITIGDPVVSASPRNITVYTNSITPGSYDNDDIATFDVVFTVGISSDGESKTYQVVKRIGIDKQKIAVEAESSTPVSIVEDAPVTGIKVVEEIAAVQPESQAKIFRRLAGLE